MSKGGRSSAVIWDRTQPPLPKVVGRRFFYSASREIQGGFIVSLTVQRAIYHAGLALPAPAGADLFASAMGVPGMRSGLTGFAAPGPGIEKRPKRLSSTVMRILLPGFIIVRLRDNPGEASRKPGNCLDQASRGPASESGKGPAKRAGEY